MSSEIGYRNVSEKEITDKKNHQRTDISGRIVGHIGYTPSYENSEPYTQIPRSEIGRIGRPTLVMLGQIDKISLERRTYKSVTHTQNSGRHEIGNRHFHKNKKRVTDKQNNDTQLYETGYIPLIQQLSRNEPRKNKTESHEHEKNSCSRFHANLVFPINSQIGRQHTVTER